MVLQSNEQNDTKEMGKAGHLLEMSAYDQATCVSSNLEVVSEPVTMSPLQMFIAGAEMSGAAHDCGRVFLKSPRAHEIPAKVTFSMEVWAAS